LLCAILAGCATSASREAREVIVATRNPASIATAIGEIGTITDRSADGRQLLVHLRDGVRAIDALVRLTQEPDVLYVTPDFETVSAATPNDPNFGGQWGLKKTQTDLAWEIWRPVTPTNLAVIDSGVDTTVPDLTNKILRNSSGAVVSYDVFTHHEGITDDAGIHGTECAGVAAAQTNNMTSTVPGWIAGVAGWNGNPAESDTTFTKIMPVRAQHGNGHASVWSDARGIDWAASHGAGVMNMSWNVHVNQSIWQRIGIEAWGPDLSPLDAAIATASVADVVMVGSAGNDGGTKPKAPADRHGVLGVAASDNSDVLTGYSNFGTWVSVAAPGSNTTVLQGGTTQFDGTSSATPIVAGEAALIRSQNPNLNEAYVRMLIRANHDPINGAHQIAADGGRVNVRHALEGAGKPTLKLTIAPDSTNAGAPIPIATVTMSQPAGSSGAVLTVSTLDPDFIQVPFTAFVPPNGSGATFEIKVKYVPKWPETTIVVKSNDGGVAAQSLWVYSLIHGLEQYLADQQTVREGLEMAMHIALDHLPRTDEPIDLVSSNPSVLHVPSQVFIGANELTRSLYFRAGHVTAPTAVTVTATIGQSVRQVVVNVVP
jgi:thermitase